MELQLIQNKIYEIRGQRVMLDFDLAEMYETETKRLKEAVRRNIDRFPDDFMFKLSAEEFENLRTQFATSNRGGTRYMPFAFTEQACPEQEPKECCDAFKRVKQQKSHSGKYCSDKGFCGIATTFSGLQRFKRKYCDS